jgi:RNA polymerase sigma factor (sigma-70 family)
VSARPGRTRSRLSEALARVGEADRLLLSLLLVERLSPSEVADVLGVSADTVRRAYVKLLATLRVSLAAPVSAPRASSTRARRAA